MKSLPFLISVFAFTLIFHLIRFPHLILENGGGAFLILFFLVINLVGLPLLIAEKALDSKLSSMSLMKWVQLFPAPLFPAANKFLWALWWGLRLLILTCLLWFFLYLSGVSLLYLSFFIGFILGFTYNIIDIPSFPNMEMGIWGSILWVAFTFAVFYFAGKGFYNFVQKWILPFSFSIFFLIFMKIILSVNDYDGLKILFYPDFLALNSQSLQLAVGHALICLFVGLGLYQNSFLKNEDKDPIELFIRVVVLNLFLAVLVGVVALPMIEQASEVPVGSRWLFEVLPRWLSYGEFSSYYCLLYFLGLLVLSFYICLILIRLIADNFQRVYSLTSTNRIITQLFSIIVSGGLIFYLQKRLFGWTGQGLFVEIDSLIVDWLMPLLSLLILWFVWNYVSLQEQRDVFNKQQVFFHSHVFFEFWRKTSFWFVPVIILLALFFSFGA